MVFMEGPPTKPALFDQDEEMPPPEMCPRCHSTDRNVRNMVAKDTPEGWVNAPCEALWHEFVEGPVRLEPGEEIVCPRCMRPWPQADENAPGKAPRSGPETSRRAAKLVAPRTGTQRHRVLEALSERGHTDEEIVRVTGMPANTVRPRRLELVEGGFVVDSGARRGTTSGHRAVVWTITPAGREALLACLHPVRASGR